MSRIIPLALASALLPLHVGLRVSRRGSGELHAVSDLGIDLLDAQPVTLARAILFTAGLEHCVHEGPP